MRKEKKLYFDCLRVSAMFAVVYLHTAAPSLRLFDAKGVWHFSNLLTSLCTIAVPLFFMISGALLLSDERTTDLGRLFRHRLPHILVPFALWSLLAAFSQAYAYHDLHKAKSLLLHSLSAPVVVPYWYIYALIPLYLLAPLLKKLVDAASPQLLRYALLLWLIVSVVLPTVQRLLPARFAQYLACSPVYTLTVDSGYIGYFLMGYFLDKWEGRIPSRILGMVAALDLASIAFATWRGSIPAAAYTEQYKSYLSLYCVVLAAAIFLLVKNLCAGRSTRSSVLQKLSGVSYCVYLVHVIVITQVHLHLMRQHFTAIYQQILFYGLTLLITFAIAFVLASVRPLCWALTGQSYQNAFNLRAFIKKKVQ